MKPLKVVQLLSIILVFCCLTSFESSAAPVPSRETQATIQSIDGRGRTLILAHPDRGRPQKLVWGRTTVFVHDSKIVAASELVEGVHCTVYYKVPFFGKPFLTKIVW